MFVVASGRIAVRLEPSPDGDAVEMAAVQRRRCSGTWSCSTGDAGPRTPSRSRQAGWSWSKRPRPDGCSRRRRSWYSRWPGRWRASSRGQLDTAQERLFYPVAARLARFLLAAAGPGDPHRHRGPPGVAGAATRHSATDVSRTLHRLATDGLVAIDPSGRVVTVLDRPRLATVTGGRARRAPSRTRRPAARRRPGLDAHPADQTIENPGGRDGPGSRPPGSPVRNWVPPHARPASAGALSRPTRSAR